MSTFAVDVNSGPGDIVGALNYALANLGDNRNLLTANVLVANLTTGEITTTSTNSAGYTTSTIVSYLYQYMAVKYANTSTGSSGFTSNSTLANYYGLRNSANTTISSNPADYVWFQAAGGFGTTKSLWYQTIGGRQIEFFVGNSAPAASYISVPDNTALDLDTITSAQNNQIVNVNAYYQANTTPATPAGGTYDFTTFTLTAPAGWSANIPGFVANTSIYISSAAFVGNTNATAAPPSTLWTVPVVYSEQFQGNTGPAGTRGFVPMGYVITASDPTLFSNANLTTAFSSSRANPSPPIGLGFAPIANDTAQFAYTDLFSNQTTTIVKQYDGAGWNTVVGNVISGGLFVPGSINANTLNTNQVYALTIASTNATVGNVASNGFWLQSSTGDARFGGNVSIGNNLTVANLITTGSLNANVVNSVNINYGAITQNQLAASAVSNDKILNQTIEASKIALSTITNAQIANSTITGTVIAQNTITGNLIVPFSIFGNAIVANTLNANAIVANTFQANTVNANAIVANSITAQQISTSYLYTGNIVSQGATLGNTASSGYWLQYTTGDARFGGTVSIGNNLNVDGLITVGNLNANTVVTSTMGLNVVSAGVGLNTTSVQSYASPTSPTLYTYTNLQPSITTSVVNQAVYVNAQISLRLLFNSSALVSVNTYLFRNGVQLGGVNNFIVLNGTAGNYSYFVPSFTFYDTPYPTGTGTATYSIGVRMSGTTGTNVASLDFLGGTMVLQGMKR